MGPMATSNDLVENSHYADKNRSPLVTTKAPQNMVAKSGTLWEQPRSSPKFGRKAERNSIKSGLSV